MNRQAAFTVSMRSAYFTNPSLFHQGRFVPRAIGSMDEPRQGTLRWNPRNEQTEKATRQSNPTNAGIGLVNNLGQDGGRLISDAQSGH